MIHLRISVPPDLADAVVRVLEDDPAVSSLSRLPGASLKPPGDVVEADVAREATNDVVDRLRALQVHEQGMVGAMAVATKDVRPYHVYVGIPAKSVRVKPNAPDASMILRTTGERKT